MIPLAAAGFIGAVIFLERLLYLHKGQIRAAEFVAGIKAALKNDAKLWREYLDHFLVLFIFLIISCLVRRMGMLLPSDLNKK